MLRRGLGAVRLLRDAVLLVRSRSFDASLYSRSYPDVAASAFAPLVHYLRFGGRAGRRPNAWFDGRFYLREHLDVARSGANPLVHFLRYGRAEGRACAPPAPKPRVVLAGAPTTRVASAPAPASRPSRLTTFHHDLLQGCQLRCVGCPISTIRQEVLFLDPADLERDLRNTDVERVETLRLFNYSEPLLHPDLPGILKVVARAPWPVGVVEISTNGQVPCWDRLEHAIGMGVIGRFVVSCDGDGSKELYERFRPPAKFERLLETLARVSDMRARLAPQMQLLTRTIIESEDQKQRWHTLLDPLGWVPEFRGWKWLPESSENRTGRLLQPGVGVCRFLARDLLYVAWDGTVVPCCAHPGAGVLGNLREQRLSEILRGETRAAFVDTLRDRREALRVCAGCEFGPEGAPGPASPILP